jgi:predicted dehydrogenase
VRVAILGGGNISATHARAAEAAGLSVAAVAGENQAKVHALATRHGAAAFASLDELLRSVSVDIVMIGSPSGCHAAQAMTAVRAGRHVLVEKPLDISTSRIDELLAAVDRAGVTVGVFFQDRLKPDVVALRHALASGAIGTVVCASGEVKWFRPPSYYESSRWRGTWSLDGGGALMNQGIHTVDLMLHLLGPVVRVSGSIATRMHRIEAEDTAAATLEFASGMIGTIEATTSAFPGRPRRLEIVGTTGSLVLEGDTLLDAAAAHATSAPENVSSPVVSDVTAHQRMVEDFVNAIRAKRAPACDGREGRRSVAVVEAIYHSARFGQPMDPGA